MTQYGKCNLCGGLTQPPSNPPIFCSCSLVMNHPGGITLTLTQEDFRKVISPFLFGRSPDDEKQQSLPFVPMTPEQKSEVQEKIEETRKAVEQIQQTQKAKELVQSENNRLDDLDNRIDRLENMMIVAAQTLQEIRNYLPAVQNPVPPDSTIDELMMTEKV